MAMPQREGRFRGPIIDSGVDEIGDNKLVTVLLTLALDQEYIQGEWVDVRDEQLEITAYCYIDKKNGDLNETQIGMLKKTFGWDGRSPFWFEDTPPAEMAGAQVTLKENTWEGKTSIRVGYVNPYDSQPRGGVTHADDARRRAIETKLGSKLRAKAGASKSTPRPSAKSKPPAAAPDAPPPNPGKQPPVSSMDDAWAACQAKGEREEMPEAEVAQKWFDAIKKVTGGTGTDDLTPEQWGAIHNEIDDIPF